MSNIKLKLWMWSIFSLTILRKKLWLVVVVFIREKHFIMTGIKSKSVTWNLISRSTAYQMPVTNEAALLSIFQQYWTVRYLSSVCEINMSKKMAFTTKNQGGWHKNGKQNNSFVNNIEIIIAYKKFKILNIYVSSNM